MTAVRRICVFGLASLLAATPAAADTIITADEVIPCWEVEPAGSDSVSFTLPGLERRTLSAFDIYEVRLADSNRVAELSNRLPQLKVALDARQPIPSRAVRAQVVEQRANDRAREARVKSPPSCTGVVDTLCPFASQSDMSWLCQRMDSLLRECEPGDSAVASLRREVNREAEALRTIPTGTEKNYCCAPLGGLLGGLLGALIGGAIGTFRGIEQGEHPVGQFLFGLGGAEAGAAIGAAVGFGPGLMLGSVLGEAVREDPIAGHRERVNDLVRRVNRAVASQP